GVLLTLTAAGRLEIDRLSAEIRAINDMFFGSLDRKSFAALCAAAQVLVKGSGKAVEYVSAVAGEPLSALNAAEGAPKRSVHILSAPSGAPRKNPLHAALI